MAQGENQKLKMLYLVKTFEEQTDEQHALTMAEIAALLQNCGVHADRKTLYQDFESLRSFGFDIICNRGERNQYFYGNRGLELAEVKLLVDALEASHFLSRSKTNQIEGKLQALVSENEARELRHDLYPGTRKSKNERVLITVDKLFIAIRSKHRVRFRLRRYTVDKKAGFANNGEYYEFSPYEMIYNGDNYYVVGYSEKHQSIGQFRVDRIQDLHEVETPARKRPKASEMESHINGLFQMFNGQPCQVTLVCDASMMDYVIDRFGEEVETYPIGTERFGARVNVELSPLFYSWVVGFAGKIRITDYEGLYALAEDLLSTLLRIHRAALMQ